MFAPIMMDYLCSNVWVFYALFTSREMWDIKICRFFFRRYNSFRGRIFICHFYITKTQLKN